jgi:hypothetical protein
VALAQQSHNAPHVGSISAASVSTQAIVASSRMTGVHNSVSCASIVAHDVVAAIGVGVAGIGVGVPQVQRAMATMHKINALRMITSF